MLFLSGDDVRRECEPHGPHEFDICLRAKCKFKKREVSYRQPEWSTVSGQADHIVVRTYKTQNGVGSFLEKISRKIVVVEEARANFKIMSLSLEIGQLLLAGHEGFAPPLGRQQAAIAGQGLEPEIEDQQAENHRRRVGADACEHGRLYGADLVKDGLPVNAASIEAGRVAED
jgi:hypothetical protein